MKGIPRMNMTREEMLEFNDACTEIVFMDANQSMTDIAYEDRDILLGGVAPEVLAEYWFDEKPHLIEKDYLDGAESIDYLKDEFFTVSAVYTKYKIYRLEVELALLKDNDHGTERR